MSNPANGKTAFPRLEVIDAMRGLAAMAVAWFHFTNGSNLIPKESWLAVTGSYGWLGVEVFFVISGFVIPYSMYCGGYLFPRDTGVFFAKRIVRLDPAYFAAVGLTLALWYISSKMPGFLGKPPNLTTGQLLAHVGYLNAFLGYEWFSPVFWTLAIEFQYYILISIAFPLFAHRRAIVRVAATAAFGFSGFLIGDASFVFHFGSLFAIGITVFQYRTGMLSLPLFVICLGTYFGVSALSLDWPQAIIGLASGLLIAFANIRRVGVLAFLGQISYSIYLIHSPVGGRVLSFGARYTNSTLMQIAVLAVAVGVTLLISYCFYRVIEKPSQKWSSAIRYRDSRKNKSLPQDSALTSEPVPKNTSII